MKCPNCNLENPPGALRCDCGYDFTDGRASAAAPVYLRLEGETIGPFQLGQINDRLARGELDTGILAWYEGSSDWVPLSQVPGIHLPFVSSPRTARRRLPLPGNSDSSTGTKPSRQREDGRPLPFTAETDDTNVSSDDADPQLRFYNQIEEAFRQATDHLMQPFDQLDDLLRSRKPVNSEGFFRLFLIHAAKFNDDCATAFATALRHSTQLDAVRGTTVRQLAKDIRAEAFEECDAVLAIYHQTVNQLMGGVEAAVEQADSMGTPMGPTGGALLGGLVAGKGSRVAGATVGGLAAMVNSISTMNEKMALYGQAYAMIEEAEKLAPVQVGEYLDAVVRMPVALVDFLGTKCFGGAVDLQKQALCVQDCTEHFDQLVSDGLRTLEAFFRHRQEVASKPKPTAQLPRITFRLGCGGVFCLALALLGLALFCSALFSEPVRAPDDTDAKEVARWLKKHKKTEAKVFGGGLA